MLSLAIGRSTANWVAVCPHCLCPEKRRQSFFDTFPEERFRASDSLFPPVRSVLTSDEENPHRIRRSVNHSFELHPFFLCVSTLCPHEPPCAPVARKTASCSS